MILLNNFNTEEIDGQYTATDTFDRSGRDAKVVVFWYKYGGITTPRYPTNLFHYKRLCQVTEVSTITTEFAEDRETFEVGKRTVRTNSGKTFNWTTSLKGNDVYNIMTLQGNHPHNRSTTTADLAATIEIGTQLGVQGALIMLHQDKNHRVMGGTVITDVQPQILEAPGVSDGVTTYNVNFTSKGEVYRFGMGMLPIPFAFLDDGSGTGITNTAAPDGTLTAFAIKDANGAFGTVPTYDLVSQEIRRGASTNFDKYVLEARLGPAGQVNPKLSNSGATYAPATSTLTLTTAPADGQLLEGIVLMPSGFPTWSEFETYHVNDIVKNGSSYWVCTPASGTTTTEEPTGTPTDWTEIADQQFPAPYYPTAVGWDNNQKHRETSQLSCAVLSWTDFNAR